MAAMLQAAGVHSAKAVEEAEDALALKVGFVGDEGVTKTLIYRLRWRSSLLLEDVGVTLAGRLARVLQYWLCALRSIAGPADIPAGGEQDGASTKAG